MFATTLVDAAQEASGRSALARQAEGFAGALRDRSDAALRYLTADEARDREAIEVLRDVMESVGPDAELMVTKVLVNSGGTRGQTVVTVVQPTAGGLARAQALTFEWVRTAQGEWRTRLLRP